MYERHSILNGEASVALRANTQLLSREGLLQGVLFVEDIVEGEEISRTVCLDQE